MTISVDRLFGGSTITTIEISKRAKMRLTMYATRYTAVNTLQKKRTENVISNFCVNYRFHSPPLILVGEELICLYSNHRS